VMWPMRRVILVEGIWDAMRIGAGSVAILGTQLSTTHLSALLLNGWREVAVWFDNDDPGHKATEKVVRTLKACGIKAIPVVDSHEPSECDCGKVERLQKWVMAA